MEGECKCDGHRPGDGEADEDIVDEVENADCKDPPVEKEDRELDHAEADGPKHVERVFRVLVDQELMGMSELAVDELLVCSQSSDCGRCGTEEKVSLALLLCVD